MQINYQLNKHLIKQAIKETAGVNRLSEACHILEQRTTIPYYVWYTTSNGSYSPKYLLFILAYLSKYVDIKDILRTEEILTNIQESV